MPSGFHANSFDLSVQNHMSLQRHTVKPEHFEANIKSDMAAKPELWYLQKIDLLTDLPPAELEQVRLQSVRHDLKPKQILHLDLSADLTWLLIDGLAKLYRQSASNHKVVEALLRPGDIFGRVALESRLRACQVQAVAPTSVLAMKRSTLNRLMAAHPDLTLDVVQRLEDRQRQLSRRVEALLFKDVEQRVVETLVDLARMHPQACHHGWSVDVRITQTDLAELIGASRQAVNRVLGSLMDRHLLHKVGRVVCIKDLQLLANSTDVVGAN
jgi:CRP-like cAMP-binding protein